MLLSALCIGRKRLASKQSGNRVPRASRLIMSEGLGLTDRQEIFLTYIAERGVATAIRSALRLVWQWLPMFDSLYAAIKPPIHRLVEEKVG